MIMMRTTTLIMSNETHAAQWQARFDEMSAQREETITKLTSAKACTAMLARHT